MMMQKTEEVNQKGVIFNFFYFFFKQVQCQRSLTSWYFHNCPAKTCGRGKETLEKSGFVVPLGFNAKKQCQVHISLACFSLCYIRVSASAPLLISAHSAMGMLCFATST